jgi:uncharacterized repeat protein (TIGR01451 family)
LTIVNFKLGFFNLKKKSLKISKTSAICRCQPMTSKKTWLRHKSLFFTVLGLSVFTYGVVSVKAQTSVPGQIENRATVGGSNITAPPGVPTRRLPDGTTVIESNPVVVSASQAALELIKTANKAAAEPGDTVVYRLAIRNNTPNSQAGNLVVRDRLPVGIRLIANTVRGTIGNQEVPFTVTRNGRDVTLTAPANITLAGQQTLNVSYAAELTPDAIRGTGRNTAISNAGGLVSNESSHQLRIRRGILSDCGTLIGRVFVDKNFDGEQQPNEPGVPNAVIYMDDGNRIVTDANGLFSVANVISGTRSGTLDLTSLPGYALAPNKYFIERNSQSRMVKLAPGSLARMNFAVTPAFSEDKR